MAWLLFLLASGLSAQQGTAFLQYIRTVNSRAAYQLGSVNRVMFEARRPWVGGVLRLRAMGSAEPLTLSERGMPQPLQVAFTSDTRTVADRAHPSPWIMELAASYEHRLPDGIAVSVYGAAIGEPALGPPAYLHRESAEANPAVPLGHHLQDVTHSSFGVVTLGIETGRVRLEASAFNDRQPDEPGTVVFYYHAARLDADAARVTVTMGRSWSVASSYGYLPAAGGGHSHAALHRMSLAAVHNASPWLITIAYGANDPVGGAPTSSSVLAEGERRWSEGHVLFARAEFVQRTAEELSLVGSVSVRQDVEAVQLGYARAVTSLDRSPVRVGAYATLTLIPPQLEPFYGRRTPLTIAIYGQLSWDSDHHEHAM